jgi:hypothetical protein
MENAATLLDYAAPLARLATHYAWLRRNWSEDTAANAQNHIQRALTLVRAPRSDDIEWVQASLSVTSRPAFRRAWNALCEQIDDGLVQPPDGFPGPWQRLASPRPGPKRPGERCVLPRRVQRAVLVLAEVMPPRRLASCTWREFASAYTESEGELVRRVTGGMDAVLVAVNWSAGGEGTPDPHHPVLPIRERSWIPVSEGLIRQVRRDVMGAERG